MAVTLKGNIKVKKGDYLGSGCQREVYTTNFKSRNKDYVVKVSRNNGGIVANILEYKIYQWLKKKKSKYLKYYPEFKSISKSGKYLLVEKCRSYEDTKHDIMFNHSSANKVFPDAILYDNHEGNWGYTKHKKPVILDMGYSDFCFEGIMDAIGMKKTPLIRKLMKDIT